mmetsp:Transcript_21386/g.36462  ORF Transcript_21386/g.36462 Transcript_21386/m.36462 type:complete len:257 (+) Transcript_21386:443-1213(+)
MPNCCCTPTITNMENYCCNNIIRSWWHTINTHSSFRGSPVGRLWPLHHARSRYERPFGTPTCTGLGALLALREGPTTGRNSSSLTGRRTYSLSSSLARCLGALSSFTALPLLLVMKSRHVPTRCSRVASHSFASTLAFFDASRSSFATPSIRAVSSLTRLVDLRLRHSMVARTSRDLSFHFSWNSSVFSQSASTPARPSSFKREVTRTMLSCFVSFLRSLRTSPLASSRVWSNLSLFSSSISSFMASPSNSNAVLD